MQGKRTINSIRLKNILSFGNEEQEIELQPLNVLIGPNASGKSNFVEVFRFLQALPADPNRVIREGGGVSEWLWKGGEPIPVAAITLGTDQVAYKLEFSRTGYRWQITGEYLSYPPNNSAFRKLGQHPSDVSSLAELKVNSRMTLTYDPATGSMTKWDGADEASSLAKTLSLIGIYKEWSNSRFSPLRQPQRPDLPARPLLEDLSNFGLVFNNLPHRVKLEITEQLKQVYEGVEEVITQIDGGTVQTLIQEKGLSSPTPLARVSDGTLRFLFLLTLLNQPESPPLICIEEPESGLHPDVIHKVAELLVEASERTQIIVTTHSEQLVSALSDVPEAVVICERDQDGTQLQRLDAESLKEWLEDYSLGDLWRKGELGGTRW
jgi:predicted ATPase